MTDGFQLTLSDLSVAAAKFRSEATSFGGVMPRNGPAPVDGGSAAINDALQEVLESIGFLHTQFAAVLADDADDLEATYRSYQKAENTITTVVKGVTVNPKKAGR